MCTNRMHASFYTLRQLKHCYIRLNTITSKQMTQILQSSRQRKARRIRLKAPKCHKQCPLLSLNNRNARIFCETFERFYVNETLAFMLTHMDSYREARYLHHLCGLERSRYSVCSTHLSLSEAAIPSLFRINLLPYISASSSYPSSFISKFITSILSIGDQ